jgi:ornithine cyclodeaminase
MRVHLLSNQDVKVAVPMREAIETVKRAFAQLSCGKATVPLRTHLPVKRYEGTTLFMPAYLSESDDLGLKVVSVFPHNLEKGLPTIFALVIVVEASTGRPLAVMDGTYLTALRTGAASGAAADLLARKESRVVAIFGSGAQARTQLPAVCEVREIERVFVYSLTREHAERFVSEMRGRGKIPKDVRVATSPAEAVMDADIICTATTSKTPVFDGRDVKRGALICGIGSFTPEMQEVDEVTVKKARVVVDSREACLAEAGDIVIPLRKGMIAEEDIAELGEILLGLSPGRRSEEEIFFFKSVGNAVQDVSVAKRALEEAKRLGLGVEVEL